MRKHFGLALVLVLSMAGWPLWAQQPADPDGAGDLAPQQDPLAEPAKPASAANPVVLRVNGDPIYAIEISMIMQTIQSQLQDRGEQVDTSDLAQSATQRAIEQKLLAQEARRFGLEVDELEVARAAEMAERQIGGRPVLEARLEASGSSYDQFLGVVREIELLRVLVEQQIMPNVVVSDEEVATYYAENPEAFEADERAHAYHMVFVVADTASPETMAATRARAEAARERALAGDEDFTAIARELSDGPSAETGGDLGWVTREALVSPLGEAVLSLEPGEISEIIRTKYGFHVATVSDRRPAETISLEDASDRIRKVLHQQKTTETVGDLLATLVENAKVENLLSGSAAPSGPGSGTD